MNRADAVKLLPVTYARALTLRDTGCDNDAIAAALGIVPEAIGPLLRLADAKLQQLLHAPPEMQDRLGSLAVSIQATDPAEHPEAAEPPDA
jgi:DNA-directed RNA polymerase specialized sigma24 family protein